MTEKPKAEDVEWALCGSTHHPACPEMDSIADCDCADRARKTFEAAHVEAQARIKDLEAALEKKHFSSCSDGSCDFSCAEAMDALAHAEHCGKIQAHMKDLEAKLRESEAAGAVLIETGERLKEIALSYAMQTYDRFGTTHKAIEAWEVAVKSYGQKARNS